LNIRPWDLLGALNENVEKPTKIWNVTMREELIEFATKQDSIRSIGINEDELKPVNDFQFTALRGELCVGGVYARVFNKVAAVCDIDDPSKFGKELLSYLRRVLMPYRFNNIANEREEGSVKSVFKCLSMIEKGHIEIAIEALRKLAESESYIVHDISSTPDGLDTVYSLLDLQPEENSPFNELIKAVFESTLRLINTLYSSPDFIANAVKSNTTQAARFLRCLCSVSDPIIRFTS